VFVCLLALEKYSYLLTYLLICLLHLDLLRCIPLKMLGLLQLSHSSNNSNKLYGKFPSAMKQLWQRRLIFAGHCYRREDQWRGQDSLRGGAKIEIMSWALTVDFGAGCCS